MMLLVIIGAALIVGGIIVAIAIGTSILTYEILSVAFYVPFTVIPLGVFFVLLGLTLDNRFSWRMKHSHDPKS